MIYSRFYQCVQLLKDHTITDIQQSMNALDDQKNILIVEQQRTSLDLRQTVINGQKSSKVLQQRIDTIKSVDLTEYATNLRLQQKQAVPSKATLLTISRIKEKNNEIDRLQQSIRENELKMTIKAKVLSNVNKDIEAVGNEKALLSDAVTVNDFLVAQGVQTAYMADFEVERIYNLFHTEV